MSRQVLVVRFQDDAGPAMLADLLPEAGLQVDVRDPVDALPLLADPEAYAAVVVLGGSSSATDDHPGVEAAGEVVRRTAAAGVPTLGICLGHQVCAVALGGEVETSRHGQRLGLQSVGWQPGAGDDALLGGLTDIATVTHWNGDVVTRVPDGAVVLARDVYGEVQAARYAPSVWGLQWHPEVDDVAIGPWAEQDRERHPAGRVDVAVAALRKARPRLVDDARRLSGALAAVAGPRR